MDAAPETILIAFLFTLGAGLATGIGSALAFFTDRTNTRFLSVALGFSAGVMIYVSFMEILPKASAAMHSVYGEEAGTLYTTLGFFAGIALIALIDQFVPHIVNPHEARFTEDMDADEKIEQGRVELGLASIYPRTSQLKARPVSRAQLMRTGLLSALAIAIHNFPEGIAVFTAALSHPEVGLAIAMAIALHNIPEGIAVSVPIFYATGNRNRAFGFSFLSGLAEPLGAVLAFLFLYPYLNETMFGFLFALVAGIMVFISLDELLPAAEEYGNHHLSIYGLIAGMAVMAASLVLF